MNHSITSKQLLIRRFERDDAEDFVSFMTDPESTRFLTFGEEQKSREGAKELLDVTIASYDSEAPLMAFAVEHQESRQFIGFCGLTPREEGTVEIMYAVMPNERGKGYATQITATLAQYAVNRLGYRQVIGSGLSRARSFKSCSVEGWFQGPWNQSKLGFFRDCPPVRV
ncbi:GNAT family N-acetyltransferase [Prosthecochloris sp.]|uniref:GNAT family N-acetyltransferase n=1 Tax=Prosthecochloris sp. TaxID=290513 RepID=UPI00257FF095|nr:GNAT family N-acetyltransferase [Prosthecochloris sp.]